MFALARYHDDGRLDTTFNGDGKVLTSFGTAYDTGIAAIAIDRNDRIVAGGTVEHKFTLARYTVDGSLDTSFRGDGTVTTDFRSTLREAIGGLCIDHRNRIVVAGRADGKMALARYWEDGALDSSFNGDGKVLTDFRSTSEEVATCVAVDASGRIVVGGNADGRFALARYTENGSLDPGFHGDGKVLTDFRSTEAEEIRAIAIDRRGRIVVAGKAMDITTDADAQFALARYTNSGSLDASFHGDGKVLTNFWSSQEETITGITGIAIDNLDRIVAGGTTAHKFALARYLEDGTLDTSFDRDGKVVTDFRSTGYEWAMGLALDGAGRIVLAGLAAGKFALARYAEDGSLDPSFDHDGKVLTNFRSTDYEGASCVAIDHHGRIVAAGSALDFS